MPRHVPVAAFAVLLLSLASMGVTPLPAQSKRPPVLSFGGIAGTMGLGAQAGLRLTRGVALRGTYASLDWDVTREVEGIEYQLAPRLRNTSILMDLHPGGSALHLTGGVVRINSRVDGTADATGTITIGSTQYTIQQIGALRGRGEYTEGLKPYAGLGLASSDRLALTLDIGVVFSGYPTVTLQTDAALPPANQAQLESNLRQEEASINQSIRDTSWARFYPVVMLGLVLRL